MKKQYSDNYSRIPNKLFYLRNEDEERENEIEYTKKGTILNVIDDNKVILILHELYMGSDFRHRCYRTIDSLLEDIRYKLDKDNRKAIKKILIRLRELKYINFDGLELSIKSTTLLKIDTSKLFEETKDRFVELAQCEIYKIMSLDCDLRSKMGMLKLYLYLKARVYKRINKSEDTYINRCHDTKSEATFQSYEYIEKYTGIKRKQGIEYVDKLVELRMITVYRNKYVYKEKDSELWKDFSNIYVINNLQASEEDIKEEIKLCVKQYSHILQERGCSIKHV